MLASLKNPALMVVDMQNDFVRRHAPMEVASARETIPSIGRLIAAFRGNGKPVVFTRYVADSLYQALAGKLTWIKLTDAPTHACVPGFMRSYGDVEGMRDAAEVIDELAPQDGDIVLDKVYFSAFHATDLAKTLKLLAVDGLVFVGTVAEMCVEDSCRHAVHFGYPTIVVEDAVSSNHPPSRQAMLDAFARNYGWVMTTDRLLDSFAVGQAGCEVLNLPQR
ncbi:MULTISPECIES: cysteine hydrolase [unclassified Mesorhizobium]|uniref:cysteine hydrolase family protein n=1 Tax=unclassified Mesorhizobium TaxID=325217 RepID=UPI00112601DA|nr:MULTISPECIES: cysteine hydrolase [unclassified Mesorhizobium]TPK45084.1 cysteine hydrolase [Mesorhizobium sp. B2-5-2]TPL15977.1 cysteine hydrolase [Mesorhizobium sp. B2-4-9]TPL17506.1 cysteine hydrolase [Mesorhizobium sp. B2-4-7]TPL33880.1 cysteine hydrolase [Mesorhizobium sp. B2-4-5]TPM71269.1 cysteine hydrolase [Mesorhizobium sp. B2-1-6]